MRILNVRYCCFFLFVFLFAACAKDEVDLTGRVYGKVTDTSTGEILSNVTVRLTPGGLSRTTGSDGTFEFQSLESGQYELQAQKEGYTNNTKLINVETGKTISGDITLTPIKADAKLVLSVSTLNFGVKNTSLSFDIINRGTTKFNWNISGLENVYRLEINPSTGTVEAGKSHAIQVNLLRERLTESKEATILINADKESLALKITAEAENKSSKIALNTNVLNFGKDYSSLTFDIKNIGNAGNVNWTVSGIDVDWIKVTPKTGTTSMGNSSTVKVDLDRTKVIGSMSTTILVEGDGESFRVTINAEEAGGDTPDPPVIDVTNGLYAYYTFEDAIMDQTETELTGIGIGSSFVDSYNGTKALKIPAKESAYLSIPDGLVDQKKMSISFWVKGLSDGHIFHVVRKELNDNMFVLAMENGFLKFVVTHYNLCYQYSKMTSFVHNSLGDAWHMVTLVSDFNDTTYATITTRLYVDGIYTDQITESDNPFSESEGMSDAKHYNRGLKFVFGGKIGNQYEPSLSPVSLTIDNLRVYKTRMLSADEVKQIYNSEKVR